PGHSSDCISRTIGPINVDPFQYPPPFLLLPRVALIFTHDFFTIRAVCVTVEVALLGLAVLATARWMCGRIGRRAMLFAPVLAISIPVLIGLQVGQFQVSTFSVSMLAMVLFSRGREAVGGGLLGFVTLGKVFPGLLALYLLGNRRSGAVAWTAASAVFFTVIALVVIGTQPFVDFLTYQLPKLSTGEAFPWLDEPDSLPINYGIYALVMNVRSPRRQPCHSPCQQRCRIGLRDRRRWPRLHRRAAPRAGFKTGQGAISSKAGPVVARVVDARLAS